MSGLQEAFFRALAGEGLVAARIVDQQAGGDRDDRHDEHGRRRGLRPRLVAAGPASQALSPGLLIGDGCFIRQPMFHVVGQRAGGRVAVERFQRHRPQTNRLQRLGHMPLDLARRRKAAALDVVQDLGDVPILERHVARQ